MGRVIGLVRCGEGGGFVCCEMRFFLGDEEGGRGREQIRICLMSFGCSMIGLVVLGKKLDEDGVYFGWEYLSKDTDWGVGGLLDCVVAAALGLVSPSLSMPVEVRYSGEGSCEAGCRKFGDDILD